MLYLVGLGLGTEEDITVRGLKAVQSCEKVFLEMYTSILCVDKERLEKFYGKEVIIADRDMVETQSDFILDSAMNGKNVAFLVVGDPFCATTHTDLLVRAAKEKKIPVKAIHNASIMNAVAACGLQLYTFGQTVSIPFFEENWRPDSFYDKIKVNLSHGFHSLCLLDIKVKERSIEALMRGLDVFEPPRFMTVNQALEQLMEIEQKRGEGVLSENTKVVGLARIGQDDQKIAVGTIAELLKEDFGAPLHSLVIVGETHPMEDEVLDFYSFNQS